jgi:hypothetical protein
VRRKPAWPEGSDIGYFLGLNKKVSEPFLLAQNPMFYALILVVFSNLWFSLVQDILKPNFPH